MTVRLCVLVLALIASSMPLYSAGAGDTAGAKPQDVTAAPLPYKETFAFSIMTPPHPQHGDRPTIWFKANEKINANINWILVPSSNFTEKLNTTLASGNLPDLVNMGESSLFSWIKQGAAVAVDDLLAKYGSNIKTVYTPTDFANIKYPIDGKTYGVAGVTELAEAFSYVVRRDWLQKVNMSAPTTYDELLMVLRAFKAKDLAGNNSTVPWGGPLEGLYYAFGIMDHVVERPQVVWTITKDGKYVAYYEHPYYRELLTSLVMLYKEGLIDKEFFIRNKTMPAYEELLASARVGAGCIWANQAEIATAAARKTRPDVLYMPIVPIKGPHGDQMLKGRNRFLNFAVISVAAQKAGRDANLMRYIDWCFGPDGAKYWNYGIEGTHHKVVDGKPVLLEPYNIGWVNLRKEGLNPNNSAFRWIKDAYVQSLLQGKKPEELSEVSRITYDGLFINTRYLYNPVRLFDTPTNAQKGPDVYPFLRENEIKTIIGEMSVDAFFAKLAIAKKDGLDQITKEMNDMYQATKK